MALTTPKLPEVNAVPRDPESLPALQSTADRVVAPPQQAFDRAVIIQFIQFCLVGAFSTALNVGLLNLLMAHGLSVIPAHIVAFSIAVTNGFIMNRTWTFRNSREVRVERQYVMFVLVNIVGLGLSLIIVLAMLRLLTHSRGGTSLAHLYYAATGRHAVVKQLAASIGELAATVPCSIWNFTANKLWTFSGAQAR